MMNSKRFVLYLLIFSSASIAVATTAFANEGEVEWSDASKVRVTVTSVSYDGRSVHATLRIDVLSGPVVVDTRFDRTWKFLSPTVVRECGTGRILQFSEPGVGTVPKPVDGDRVRLGTGDAIEKRVTIPLFWPEPSELKCIEADAVLRQPDPKGVRTQMMARLTLKAPLVRP